MMMTGCRHRLLLFCLSSSLLQLLLLPYTVRAEDHVDANGNYLNQFTVCDDSAVVVEAISLLCDSPGTYYYGSGKYRNSASCQAGDKAKLNVGFEIVNDLSYEGEDSVTPYFTLYVSGYGSVAAQSIYANVPLCEVGDLKAVDGQTCPGQGYYQVSLQYYWGEQNDNYEYSFNPKVMVGFASNPQKGIYDLGGANTNKCSGNVFTNWTKGVRRSAANTIKSFFATFGILLGAILSIFAAGWCIMRKSSNKPKEIIVEDILDEKNEQHKVELLGDTKNHLVDFT